MTSAANDFQVFIKPVGSRCNLNCAYCYYLGKPDTAPEGETMTASDRLLERLVIRHIEASTQEVIMFSWHGGEPTLLGLDRFRQIADLQRKHLPRGKRVLNGIQTNGTLLSDSWCRFFREANFMVGISLDGPMELHDRFRRTKQDGPTFSRSMRGMNLLIRHGIPFEILCVVNAENGRHPLLVYNFFKQLGAKYISFLPLVEHNPHGDTPVTDRTVPPDVWGTFLCDIFDTWKRNDIGHIKVQIFEEAARTAFGQEHTLCIFKKTCGRVPVIEQNGDFYACDHFVDESHRMGSILDSTLNDLLENPAQRAFGKAKLEMLPEICKACPVLDMCNGGCPKNRFVISSGGEAGLNYLCAGYRRFFLHCKAWVDQVADLWETSINPEASH